MRKGKEQKQNKLVWIITTPFRVLGKARDAYVRSITQCGHNMNYSNPVDAAGRFEALPRSYSVATSRSDNEDFAELLRAASARTLGNRIDVDLVLKQQAQSRPPISSNGLPKSTSVGMGRIDEDTPYDLSEGDVGTLPKAYPRSRSYAVGKTSAVL
ncbi:uncharacterized protein LOC124829752 [Vigna umbellata]|uniref:Uncharacterized protein n=2 Tax=Phaseolus angularis TaxID=3914 RepID=A0A0L9UI23_PHAAN|nr:uncharacterized protein LOC108331039 [Vigna angularis]XP_047159271.1 uncharacterized protein LOC124829752 [Vigna umbellata]KAG2400486.1 uncharacterized protein HKW66_Vig0096600 [Vigna angularis]KOM42212.1 hypothetical protein LR48_Vigan04g241000 [Vigna angularis]BAT77928.1 hypothetical protein VIGAN_02054300 [Vigna angularis var. angularis]